ncbi:MAG: FAD-dependent oxidoreductase [gamma proteobacterium endosymbiont of Lamellibrachia anaximandri]|nr:FAD-dependent oxidoreductase [gamma proteobacterium endosymbiont of Lamellibrachia anaximandri]MBL3619588.1 FAD-dependent oxidoreductase [gamma proteobacterium endosymbiont of Lamellibrachia anaximandri]
MIIQEAAVLFENKRSYLYLLSEHIGLNPDVDTIEKLIEGLHHKFSFTESALTEAADIANNSGNRSNSKASPPFRPYCPVGVNTAYFASQIGKIQSLINEYFEGLSLDEISRLLSEAAQTQTDHKPELTRQLDRHIYDAHKKIMAANPLYIATSSICPSELLCDCLCQYSETSDKNASGTRKLESFIAGWVVDNQTRMNSYGWFGLGKQVNKHNKKAAIVGTGPAGLTAAYYLAKSGVKVTVYDSCSEVGGIMTHGIPEFRLPKTRVKFVIKLLEDMGIVFALDFTVRNIIENKEKQNYKIGEHDYDEYLLAIGKGEPCYPGNRVNYKNVYFDTTFLREMNYYVAHHLTNAKAFLEGRSIIEEIFLKIYGKSAVVVGAGNSALDVARTLMRFGVGEVCVISNAVEKKVRKHDRLLTVLKRELGAAKKEGVKMVFGANLVKIIHRQGKNNLAVGVQFLQEGKAMQQSAAVVVYAIGRRIGELCNLGASTNDHHQIINYSEQKGAPFAAGDCTVKYVSKNNPHEMNLENPHHYHNVIAAVSSGRHAAKACIAKLDSD